MFPFTFPDRLIYLLNIVVCYLFAIINLCFFRAIKIKVVLLVHGEVHQEWARPLAAPRSVCFHLGLLTEVQVAGHRPITWARAHPDLGIILMVAKDGTTST
jgi:hypothetical protein